jgi:hypothetical protein
MASGLLGYWDAARGCAVSPLTRSSEHMAAIRIPYACKLLFQVSKGGHLPSIVPVDTAIIGKCGYYR